MADIIVSNSSELLKAIAAAGNGDTIRLASGTYSDVLVRNVINSATVTITSLDRDHPAVFTDLSIRDSAGFTITNVEMVATKDVPFQVYSSSRVSFDGIDVHGTLNGSSQGDVRGMIVRDSDHVTVSNSHFHELSDALTHLNNDTFTVTGNVFDLIRDNGVPGGGTSHLTISNNVFKDFDHGDDWIIHPDAIQLWTTNTTTAATDILICGNVFNRGIGTPVQGIFIGDEVGTLAYRNLTIADNVFVGTNWQGISVNHAADLSLTGNVLIAGEDQGSWIGVTDVAAATLSGNFASRYNYADSAVSGHGDVQTAALDQGELAMLTGKLDAMLAAGGTDGVAAQFRDLVLSSVDQLGYVDGAPLSGPATAFDTVVIDGTGSADRLWAGSLGSYHLIGRDGNDQLYGNAGASSTLEGGRGDDAYTIERSEDIIVERAGEGNDTVYSMVDYTLPDNVETLYARAAALVIHGNHDGNFIVAAAGGGTLYGESGDDTLQGGSGGDQLYGGTGSDRLFGNDGNDRLAGDGGDDKLYGGNGDDRISGAAGNDYIEGGGGADMLTGGTGADSFFYRDDHFSTGLAASRDVITDFDAGADDRICLALVDADHNSAADDAFRFIGTSAFSGTAGELCYIEDGDGVTVLGDTGGDGVADVAIHLVGVTSVVADNFIL